MQSGGVGVETEDTGTLNSVCGYVCCMFGKKKIKGADYLPLSSSASSPASSPHTLWTWYRIILRVVRAEARGGGGRGSFVLSAYWKCTVGFFPVWETVYAKLSPNAPIFISSG